MSLDLEKLLDTTNLIDEIERLVNDIDDCLLPKMSTNEWITDIEELKKGKLFEKCGMTNDEYPQKRLGRFQVDNMLKCCQEFTYWREYAIKSNCEDLCGSNTNKSIRRRKLKKDIENDIRNQRDKFNSQHSMNSNSNNSSATDRKQNIQKKSRKLWRIMIKKEMGKCARQRLSIRRDKLAVVRKAARECARLCRQKAMASNKCAKDALTRGRKLAREISMCWRQLDKEEKTSKKKADRILSEQKRKNLEMLEAKRQQRKLNYLITQTELYTHFMSRKMGKTNNDDDNDCDDDEMCGTMKDGEGDNDDSVAWTILERLDEVKESNGEYSTPGGIDEVTFDKSRTFESVKEAVDLQSKQINSFSSVSNISNSAALNTNNNGNSIFQGELKSYQEKGRQWLLNLFEQGINGILADEMGLGKTVQTLAFLASLAEKYDLWGPFLVVAPASTVHNWAQELARFVPEFRVVPYWGSVSERRILRRYWGVRNGNNNGNKESILRRDSSYHVVVTSYQVVLQDARMVSRVRWQYLVLDEAHAIKNTASQRWSTLLSFECRNRLLLTGTPIQNTMQELWALLHFIMPTLFDSHEEFNDWFSRDIESQAAVAAANNSSGIKSGINGVSSLTTTTRLTANQLSRLHLILQPFMLRRIKVEVEHELPQKIEKLLQCRLSNRQQKLYERLKKRIRIDDLGSSDTVADFNNIRSGSNQKNLLNLVMQLRKVCNHPDLIEQRMEQFSVTTRFISCWHLWPRLLADNCDFHDDSKSNLLNIHCPVFVQYDSEYQLTISRLVYAHLVNMQRYESIYEPVMEIEGFKDRITSFPSIVTLFVKFNRLGFVEVPKYAHLIPRLIVPPQAIAAPIQLAIHAPTKFLWQLPSLPTNISIGSALAHTIALVSPKTHIADSTKLAALDSLLFKLKRNNHRVLIYSQMTRMIDIIENLLRMRRLSHIRLDGSSRLCDRRDMVARFQHESGDIFAFLLSTRAGGLGINLTAADTVIFYDSDWNPTVDEQAMDRAHRLGQQRTVTVYRLVCANTVEQHMLGRAEEKRQMQRMVIAGATDLRSSPADNVIGGNGTELHPSVVGAPVGTSMGPKDVASLLLEDEEVRARLEQTRKKREQDIDNRFLSGDYTIGEESALQRKRRAAWKGLSRTTVRTKRSKVILPSTSNQKS